MKRNNGIPRFNKPDMIRLLMDEKIAQGISKDEIEKAAYTLMLGFISVVAVATGIMSKGLGDHLRFAISFGITQTEFLLVIYLSLLLCYSDMRGAYIRHLEKKINTLAGKRLVTWETKIGANLFGFPHGFYFWISAILSVILLSVYWGMMITSSHILHGLKPTEVGAFERLLLPHNLYWLAGFENIVMSLVLILAFKSGGKARIYLERNGG